MRKLYYALTLFFLLLAGGVSVCFAQKSISPTYVDAKGVFRWTKGKAPVYLWGVNYTLPFAYGYRSVKALNLKHEEEIDKDVYHLARMGVEAFRVHVWDTEISDSLGNLKENEHLRLFDYLLYKLKQRGIRIIITPIAFWGNGYPERDERTGSFSDKYGKGGALVNEDAFKAQERYLQQFFKHVNPYTKLTYTADDNVIATEINNEPHPSGPKARATEYINRMKAAINSTGWSKPVFYNISESPYYAYAVAKSNVNGFSFQWYPTGLVAGHEQKGNMLPNVDRYTFPYDTIPEFKNKARMVYEFDAADVLQSYLYPAVARSFKQAGFQWVTQFAYDPLATAYANTEYQTHFLNLAYTPAKAISFLIASRVFHLLPAGKKYGTYPQDSVFDAYHVSYKQAMSEMNTVNEFYYSGSTNTQPVDNKRLAHVAGVGSSALVKYQGYGAYFLDKLENGIWRLEVMPDAITIRDPFARPSPSREAVYIAWNTQSMQLALTDLGNDFKVNGINAGNTFTAIASQGKFNIAPGTYLLVKVGNSSSRWTGLKSINNLNLNEFVAPKPRTLSPQVSHTPLTEVSTAKSITVKIKVVNIDSTDKVTLSVNSGFSGPSQIAMTRVTPYDYTAEIPANTMATGILNYRVVVQRGISEYFTFPGNHSGNPYQWDNVNTDYWQTFIATPKGNLSLFDATADREMVNPYFPEYTRTGGAQFVSGPNTGKLVFRVATQAIRNGQLMGMQLYVRNKLKGRTGELASFTKIMVRARATTIQPTKLRIGITATDASTYAAFADLSSEFKTLEIPLTALKPDSSLLLPRPYPGFLPLWFKVGSFAGFALQNADKLEITAGHMLDAARYGQPFGVEVESVWLAY
ncbi:membrane or secreted protein [Mucilaginibacter sp. PAMB04168]|uniref:membrane or secreted protein n=1 Tax=Mucilaginibacter sp. PAMB04168 TaxID=3138567 RepID=UPI0031F6247B